MHLTSLTDVIPAGRHWCAGQPEDTLSNPWARSPTSPMGHHEAGGHSGASGYCVCPLQRSGHERLKETAQRASGVTKIGSGSTEGLDDHCSFSVGHTEDPRGGPKAPQGPPQGSRRHKVRGAERTPQLSKVGRGPVPLPSSAEWSVLPAAFLHGGHQPASRTGGRHMQGAWAGWPRGTEKETDPE